MSKTAKEIAAAKLLKELQDRAVALEVSITGDEDTEKLQELIQAEMESLDTWDGDYFTDKATEPAAEEVKKTLESVIEECSVEQLKQLLEKLGLEYDEAADIFGDKVIADILKQDAEAVAKAVKELAAEEKEEGAEETEETEYKLAEGDTVQSILSNEDDDAICGVADQLGIKKITGKGWRKKTIENILEHDDNKVVGIMIELGVLDAGETKEEEFPDEIFAELNEEEKEAMLDKISASVEAADYYQRKDMCNELHIKPGGKGPALANRLLAYEEHNAMELQAVLDHLELWVEEVTEEAEKSRALRERRNKLEELKEEGVGGLISSMRLLIAIDELEDAHGIAEIGLELWPKNTDLADRKKSIETQIKERDTAASTHELKVQQEKLEKKNKGRGRKAKVSTIQDCVDACNELIVVTKATEKALALDGKANRRLLYAQTILGRLLKNQYR